MALRPTFANAKTLSKQFCSPSIPAVIQCDLLLAKLADRTLSVTERGYAVFYVSRVTDTVCGNKRNLLLEYDRDLFTRDLTDCDIVSFCNADTCIEALLDGVKTTADSDDGGGQPSTDRYISAATIVDGPGGSKKIRFAYSDSSDPIEVTLPSVAVGTPSPYPDSMRIDTDEGTGERTLVIVLTNEEEVSVSLGVYPSTYVSGVSFSGTTLTISREGAPDQSINLSSLSGGGGGGGGLTIQSSENTQSSDIEDEFAATVDDGVVVRWLDAYGVPRISMGNADGWVHLVEPWPPVIQPYSPDTRFLLSTTYTDVPGSSISYTPKSASSRVVYRFAFHIAGAVANNPGTAHIQFVSGGTIVPKSKVTFRPSDNNSNGSYIPADLFTAVEFNIPSWGTTPRTLKLMARNLNSANPCKIHETYWLDGVASSQLVNANLTVHEYFPAA